MVVVAVLVPSSVQAAVMMLFNHHDPMASMMPSIG
jgi:hypothetical protein